MAKKQDIFDMTTETEGEKFSESYLSIGLGLLVVLVVGVLLVNFFKTRGGQSTNQNTTEGSTEQQATSSAQLPDTHTVTEGETLWGISEKYYQTGDKWSEIASQNGIADIAHVEVGKVLALPKVQQVLPETGISDNTDGVQTGVYTVHENDTLWDIACKTYNDCYAWPQIAEENNLDNPGVIHTGDTLSLPN